ncbi:1-acyl-sn-glycerol-3-phosphate acyltransferase [Candidatus Woesearchaeota archaeon]|nr:1-acyl-sn-glycerol-3-phosphate acyltransferase [Candidatus Woesearchaeota archaeon]
MEPHEHLYWPWLQHLARQVLGAALHLRYAIHFEGRHYIPAQGPLLVIANHTRAADSFLIGLGTDRLHFGMGKEEYYFWPVVRPLLTWLGAFPVARRHKYQTLMQNYPTKVSRYLLAENQFNYDEYLPQHCRATILTDMQCTLVHDRINLSTLRPRTIAQYLLMKGEGLLIHPEGTRHADGNIRGCRPGVAKIVLDLQERYGVSTSLVPCAITYGTGIRRSVRVTFGEPLRYENSTVPTLTERIEQTLRGMYAQNQMALAR